MSITIADILNKGAQVSFNGVLHYCYNVTHNSLMHFVKCGKNGVPLSCKNKHNLINYTRSQVISFHDRGIAFVEVGDLRG